MKKIFRILLVTWVTILTITTITYASGSDKCKGYDPGDDLEDVKGFWMSEDVAIKVSSCIEKKRR